MKKVMVLLCVAISVIGCTSPSQERDLLVDAERARLTAEAARDYADSQARYLTATAEAPIVHITETAAAFELQQQYWTATAVSVQSTETAAFTQTAMAWTPTPNATQTAVFAALNAEGTQIANNIERDNLELERQRKNNEFWRLLPGVSFAIVAMAALMLLFAQIRRQRYQPAAVDERGNLLPILDVVDGTVTDVDRNPNHQSRLDQGLLRRYVESKLQLPPPTPNVTAERQDATTERDQLIDLATRGLPSGGGQSAEKRRQLAGQEMTRQLSSPNLDSRFRILDASTSNLDVIDGEIIEVLDQDWQKASEK